MQFCQRREKQPGKAVENGGEQVVGCYTVQLTDYIYGKLVTNTRTCTFFHVCLFDASTVYIYLFIYSFIYIEKKVSSAAPPTSSKTTPPD